MFITLLVLGISASLVAVAISFVANLFLQGLPVVRDAVRLLAVVTAVVVVLRLALALPAVVNDEQGVAEGLTMARSVSARRGVWARLTVAATFLATLFILSFAALGIGATILFRNFGDLFWLVAGFQALWMPVAALFLYSAYRRLVVPGGLDGTWAEPQVPLDVPPFGQVARALMFGAFAFGAIGLVAFIIAAAS